LETTKFIGREVELRKIKKELKNPSYRLLTLVGPGGVGKTRLAIKAANDVALEADSLFKDGIHFIPLEDQQEVCTLAARIAGVLNIPLSGIGEPIEQLLNYLQDKQMLLVLDNFEHLMDSTEQIAEILKKDSKIKILVTSREALNLSEEWRFELVGLPLPDLSKVDLIDNSAVQLFVERARHVRSDFMRENNASCIAQICRLVDGMPLAIELAASWIRSLSCADIAGEIESNLDFLETNLRNIPERHHSMRVVFEQSWSKLNEAEKDVYMSLSVFTGSFSLSAAKSVAGAKPAILTSLVDKSLIRRDHSDCYQLHAPLRKYAAEKLADSEDRERKIRDRHSVFYSDLA
jgi:predicted ATPase